VLKCGREEEGRLEANIIKEAGDREEEPRVREREREREGNGCYTDHRLSRLVVAKYSVRDDSDETEMASGDTLFAEVDLNRAMRVEKNRVEVSGESETWPR
jgi:DUF4097 and DUF4098 domain-containing protein YvlB